MDLYQSASNFIQPNLTLSYTVNIYTQYDSVSWLFYMNGTRRPLIGWHSVSNNYLDGFCVATLITRERFQYL